MAEHNRERQEQPDTARVGLYSIGVNVVLVGLKAGLAAATGSLALTADAVHSLVDVFASLAVLVGLLLARRRSRSFPYGLYKIENMVSVLLAFLIFLAGYEIAREAILAPPRQVANAAAALVGVAFAILIPFLFSRYESRLAAETGSPSLAADSQHFRTDVLSSTVVFAALLGDIFRLPLDRAAAGVVVLFVLRSGWELLVDGMRVLLDASLSFETLETVRRVIAADPNVAEIRSLVGRSSGSYKFIEAQLALRTRDLEKAHQISERIEAAIRQRVPHVDRVLIHYEPVHKEIWKWAVPLDETKRSLSDHFGEAPFFAILGIRQATGELVSREVLANPYREVERQKGIKVAEFLVSQGIDGLATREDLGGRGPAYVLANAGVDVHATKKRTLDEVVAELASLRGGR